MPTGWQRGRLRKTLAALGGLAGAAPGATWGAVNVAGGRPFGSNELFQQPSKPGLTESSNAADFFRVMDHIPPELSKEVQSSFQKVADLYPGSGLIGPAIDVDQFTQTVWNDPRVAGPLGPRMSAAATGLINSAAHVPGKYSPEFVTPMDVARIAAGMGSGYLSGMLVGKALGLLTGMPDKSQERLKSTGMYAGLIANLIPIAFGA
jgi:hypothetical protein